MKVNGTQLGILVMMTFFVGQCYADEIKFKFKNPSFSGQGTGAHYLTIENQEKSRRDKIKADIEAALKSAERADQNRALQGPHHDAENCITDMSSFLILLSKSSSLKSISIKSFYKLEPQSQLGNFIFFFNGHYKFINFV